MIDHLFRCTVTWLAPMLCFTAEEAWCERYRVATTPRCISSCSRRCRRPGATTSSRRSGARCAWCAASSPARWRSSAPASASAPRWRPHPFVYVSNPDLFEALVDIDLAEVCITSAATLIEGEGPPTPSACRRCAGVAVVADLAEGTQVRALVENLARGRQRPAISRRDAARRAGAARMGRHAQGGGVSRDARDYLWGPLTRLGLAAAAITCALDQALKLWLLFVFDLGAKGTVALAPFVDLVLTWNTGHQLRLVPAGGPVRPVGAAGAQGGGGGAALDLAGPGRQPAGRRCRSA